MLRLPSLQHEFSLVFSEDPALDLPELGELAPNAPAEEVAARQERAKERSHKLKVARETGRWDAITRPGDKPTTFSFRALRGTTLTWLHAEQSREKMSDEELYELAFRLALTSIDNLDGFELQFEPIGDRKALHRSCVDRLYAIGQPIGQPMLGHRLVYELGMFVMERAIQGVPPL
jgi:hypothetical protein